MVNIINHHNKPICYPINAFSCIPKDAIEAKYNETENRWYFRTATNSTFQTIDIEEAKLKNYYVPDMSSVYITNKHTFNYIFGFILIILSIIFLSIYDISTWMFVASLYTIEDFAGILLVDLSVFGIIVLMFYLIQVIVERNYTKKY